MLRGNVPALLDLMHLERIDDDLFLGRSPDDRAGRVYGGQVAAQAVIAAARTVDRAWDLHSLHAYFLRPGDPRAHVLFVVERIRDGRSFATRRIVARQAGRAIFSLDASFQRRETGLEHAGAAPAVTPPEDLPTLRQVFAELRERGVEGDWDSRPRPFDLRWTRSPWLAAADGPQPPEQHVWLRLTRPLAPTEVEAFEDLAPQTLHRALLVYASDHTILDTALRPHAGTFDWRRAQVASLDHAMWFHGDVDVDRWILYDQDAPSSHATRGFSRGALFQRDGGLVASAMQESLMRQHPEPEASGSRAPEASGSRAPESP
jgi:acyl-CoA thioesterase-2